MTSISSAFRRVWAVHPHWEGSIRLSTDNNRAHLENFGTEGNYYFSDNELVIEWDSYPREKFTLCGSDTYVSEKLPVPELEKLVICQIGKVKAELKNFGVLVPGTNYEVFLRSRSSDIPTFGQVFGHAEYESDNLPTNAEYILDIGGNIGLASVFFALKYPSAKLFTVEPGRENFAALARNTAALNSRVTCIQAAAWHENAPVNLASEEEDGTPLGNWGLKVSAAQSGAIVDGLTIEKIIELSGFKYIDILKIDIEGSELEVFSNGSDEWLPKIGLIIIETHDRFREGSEATVRTALAGKFEELPRKGENLFFRKIASP